MKFIILVQKVLVLQNFSCLFFWTIKIKKFTWKFVILGQKVAVTQSFNFTTYMQDLHARQKHFLTNKDIFHDDVHVPTWTDTRSPRLSSGHCRSGSDTPLRSGTRQSNFHRWRRRRWRKTGDKNVRNHTFWFSWISNVNVRCEQVIKINKSWDRVVISECPENYFIKMTFCYMN